MIIKELSRAEYAGRKFTTRYVTNGFWDITKTDSGFEIRYKSFEKAVEKSFDDAMFGDWLENPVAFGAFDDENLVGFIEGSIEAWNNRFRISNICVFSTEHRRNGIGTALMDKILAHARSLGARMAVLETQTCNEKAISFYKKQGFDIIGFDLFAYTDNDPERHEIRLEMGIFI